jgi:hypothetical protein
LQQPIERQLESGQGEGDASSLPYIYYAYGMVIHSEIELPELVKCDVPNPDLVFRRASLSRPLPEEGHAVYEFGTEMAYIALGGFGQFLIVGPSLVEFAIAPNADSSYISLILLGSVLATVLQFRGFLTLHASGVDINGRGIVFLGDKGAGKSTTAAAFVRAGYKLLADDVIPIDLSQGAAQILPGFAQLKLSIDASGAIALPAVASFRIGNMNFRKNRLLLSDSFMARPVPVGSFYVLARGNNLSVRPLIGGVSALAAVMRNAYHSRFGTQVFQGVTAAQLLRHCAAIIRRAPVKILTIPHELNRLGEIVTLVEIDNA